MITTDKLNKRTRGGGGKTLVVILSWICACVVLFNTIILDIHQILANHKSANCDVCQRVMISNDTDIWNNSSLVGSYKNHHVKR